MNSINFSPDSDTSIRNVYQTIYNEKEKQLNRLKKISFGAIASTGIALTTAFILTKLPAKETYIDIRQIMYKNQRQLLVTGYITDNDSSLYRIVIVQHQLTKNEVDLGKPLLDTPYLNTKSGEFQYSIPVDTAGQYYTATLEWNQKGTRSISQSTSKPKK